MHFSSSLQFSCVYIRNSAAFLQKDHYIFHNCKRVKKSSLLPWLLRPQHNDQSFISLPSAAIEHSITRCSVWPCTPLIAAELAEFLISNQDVLPVQRHGHSFWEDSPCVGKWFNLVTSSTRPLSTITYTHAQTPTNVGQGVTVAQL